MKEKYYLINYRILATGWRFYYIVCEKRNDQGYHYSYYFWWGINLKKILSKHQAKKVINDPALLSVGIHRVIMTEKFLSQEELVNLFLSKQLGVIGCSTFKYSIREIT